MDNLLWETLCKARALLGISIGEAVDRACAYAYAWGQSPEEYLQTCAQRPEMQFALTTEQKEL